MMNKIAQHSFWSMPVAEVIKTLETSIDGLSNEEAALRLKSFGPNLIKVRQGAGKLEILWNQIKTPLILVLIVAGVITVLLKDYKDSIFIFVAVFINTVLGFYQENKAETALADLKTYIKERVRVLRQGGEKEIDASEIVPGDVVRLGAGIRVPADLRLIALNDLGVDQSILTGESLADFDKTIEPSRKEATIDDQTSMVFAGTLITEGIGWGVAVRTGKNTELGAIASMVSHADHEETPLQKSISKFTFNSSIFLTLLTAALFGVGVYFGYDPLQMFIISVAIAVSAVPEGLPIALTVILAIGVERLAKRKGIVRKLSAVETLGSTTLILTDKTGTLTEAKMKLSYISGSRSEKEILSLALLNSDVIIENPDAPYSSWRVVGRPLDVALLMASAEKGIMLQDVRRGVEIVSRKPFNSGDKFALTKIKFNGKTSENFLGAPEIILDKTNIGNEEKTEIMKEIDQLAFAGNRVLAVSVDMEFVGIIAFKDPIRATVKDAIRRVKAAGMKTVIMTGDHKGTAFAIAEECGIATDLSEVLTHEDIVKMSDEELKKKLATIRVFARVLPEDKARIAKLYKSLGEIVAMTGDGVNDAPALKEADIGVAVGSGTDVAKGAADIIILDDNFETIVAAVEEGRRTLHNIKKVIVYLFSNVFDGLIVIGGCLILGIPIPLNPAQILWINFFLDSFPGIALGFENGIDHLRDKPHKKGDLIDPTMKFLIFVIGVFTSLCLLFIYIALLKTDFDRDLIRTFIFASFSLYTLFLIFSVKDLKENIFSYNPFSNKYLNTAVVGGFVFTFAAIYLPPLQKALGTVSLPPIWLLGVSAFGLVNIFLVELAKLFFRKRSY